MRIEELAERLRGKRNGDDRWMASCPVAATHANGDVSPSLSLRRGRAGRNLLHCFSGDSVQDIAAALGIPIAEVLYEFPSGRPAPNRARSMAARLYGEMLAQKWVGHLEEYQAADEIRTASKLIRDTRQQATARGLDAADETIWGLLALAAAAQREVWLLEEAL